MRLTNTKTEDRSPESDVLAIHVMGALSRAQAKGRRISLEDVALEIGARKTDVRTVVTRLHQQGFVDATRMRVTMLGFALGAAVTGRPLKNLRRPASAPRQLPVAA